jgi:WD40 repeat protein/3',5'-cyclic AMP phosphodiesterase CpdA
VAESWAGQFLVRLITISGATAGVGVLVGSREIVTCAHVVNTALGREQRAQERPDGVVAVAFPLLAKHGGLAPAGLARVVRWVPPPRQGAAGDDLAGLLLEVDVTTAGATPARLALVTPPPGRLVDVFGYPGVPPRPDGGWVEATLRLPVGGGQLQLDGRTQSALRIQPGYSGSPVVDRSAGRVIGLISTAPRPGSGDTDSYAISAERLVSLWPEVLDPDGVASRANSGQRGPRPELTVLHLSDPQFGRNHLFGGNGLTLADRKYDTLFGRLHEDLNGLAAKHGLRPDLVVVTGDLAERGMRSEFDQVIDFLSTLCEAVGVPRRHVALVPGNHDINWALCSSYFDREAGYEREPVAPYWPKWEPFAAAFETFYEGVPGMAFAPGEPWTLFELPDLAVVVAGLNSTMAESHREEDHYGWLGEEQLRWFATRLADYRRQGWLRLGAVHHNVVRGAVLDEENLRDTDDLDRLLGQPGLINLLLHGHTHDGRLQRLASGLQVLSTGSSAVNADARPQEVPNQYQLITVHPDSLTRYARQYVVGQRRWVGDTRVSPTGSDWRDTVVPELADVSATFISPDDHRSDDNLLGGDGPLPGSDPTERRPTGRASPGEEFREWVTEATRVRHPKATIVERWDAGYLRVSLPLPTGGMELWPVGVIDAAPTAAGVEDFATRVHAQFAARDPSVRSVLVYSGAPAESDVQTLAARLGIRLRSFVDYQGLIDLRPLARRQAERLAADQIYPAELYVDQRYRALDDDPADARNGILEQVIGWLSEDGARFVLVLGDFGRGKSYLLRQLTRTLPGRQPALPPVLVDLRTLEKAPSLEELLAQHLVRADVDVNLERLRYMVRSGRLAVLFDGFDELALRATYDNAAEYLQMLLSAVSEHAKIVVTSRTQHFGSTAQVRTALGARVAGMSATRVAVLEDFTDVQIRQFLIKHYGGDEARADSRYRLLDDVHDLLGLSHNPRMLSFVADLDEERLREVQREHGAISAAELYRELIEHWLTGETERQHHRAGVPSFKRPERERACAALALRLWTSTAPTIPLTDLEAEVGTVLSGLVERGYSLAEATQAVGSGTLLVRTDDGAFTFVHQSIMEWLVAEAAAERLLVGESADLLASRPMSALMIDFLCDLAGHQAAADWAGTVLAQPDAPAMAKQNALAVRERLRSAATASMADLSDALPPAERVELAEADLRERNLTGTDLRGADLRNATLRGMRLLGTDLRDADMRGADFSGATLMDVRLTGARLDQSRWTDAAILGGDADEGQDSWAELDGAAIAGRDPAVAIVAASGTPHCVAFSPNGRALAIGRGWAVELVDAVTERVVRVLSGHTRGVNAVAFSPDGTLIATGSDDRTARIWDASTGAPRTTLTGHTDAVRAVAFSPDGTVIATGSADRTARIWDAATGGALATLTGSGGGGVRAVAFSPDGTLIATGSDHRTAWIWDASTGAPRASLSGHTDAVRAVAFSPDGTLIVTGSDDGTGRIWDSATGGARATLTGHTDAVGAVAFSPDGTVIATGSADGIARTWDSATGAARTTLTGGIGGVRAVAFSPDGALIATGSDDGTGRIWDSATGAARVTLTGHTDVVRAVAFSPDGALIVTGSDDGSARVWDSATGAARATTDGRIAVYAVAFSPDGTLIATGSADGIARTWDSATGAARTTFIGDIDAVRAVAFSPGGALIAAGSADGIARTWDSATGAARTTTGGHIDIDAVYAVAFSLDGTLIATGSAFGSARIRDSATGAARTSLTGHIDGVYAMAFSPDGTLIATGSADGIARTWDSATGAARTTFIGHTDWVYAVAFSPDGTLIATGSADGTARIWRVQGGEPVSTLLPLEEGFAVLLPDGSYKVSGDAGDMLWWAIKLRRFVPGELDAYVPDIQRRDLHEPLATIGS